MEQEIKSCQNCKNQFVIEPDDFLFYEKINVPPPTWCPLCRFQRRLAFMNDRELYRRTCGMCKKEIVTMYPPESRFTVYCNPCWWSDAWDGSQYAREYDPTRPFLQQLKELNESTPQWALELNYPTLINSPYINHAATAKNCYLIFFADECENVLYSEYLLHDTECMDSTMISFCELCYGMAVSGKCFRSFFSEDCENCHDIYFCKDCVGCSDCFGCTGLRNKRYYLWNEPYSKEEYEQKIRELNIGSYRRCTELQKQAHDLWQTFPHKFQHAQRNMNSTGEYIYESKNSKDLYDVAGGAEDSRFCQLLSMSGTKDAYDYCIWGNNAEMIYEAMVSGEGAYNVRCSFEAWSNVRNIEYCINVITASDMFGCANIRNKQYCILNKQYSKEEFETLRSRIIRDMTERPYRDAGGRIYPYGEFFPIELSLFSYNQTYAQQFFPLTREEALQKGLRWYESKPSEHVPTLKPDQIPDHISEIADSIVNEIIECADCKKAFRLLMQELVLLRRFGLPIPRECFNCRFKKRWARINKPRLYHRTCVCKGAQSAKSNAAYIYQNQSSHFHGSSPCPNEFETSYVPDRPEIVYCEQCYQSEVV